MLEDEIKEALKKLENKNTNSNKEIYQENKSFFTKSRVLLIIMAFFLFSSTIIYRYLADYFLK